MTDASVDVIAKLVSKVSILWRPKGNLESLGGWLVLLGLSIALFCLGVLMGLLEADMPIVTDMTWATLSASDRAVAYAAGLEFSIELAFVMAEFCVIFLFLEKSKHFPYWFILLGVAWLIYRSADLVVISVIAPEASFLRAAQVIYASLWFTVCVLYLAKSRRVKNTFTY